LRWREPGRDAGDERELTRLPDGRNGILLGRREAFSRRNENGWRSAVVQAYILIQTEVGKAAEVAAALGELPGVTHAEDITGPYDVIVRAEAADMGQLTSLVTAHMHPVPGLTRTITCPVVHL
jgi:DNA-binding Lrp family transcriptional regulator